MESHTETLALRTALRELVALSTIPAAWVGREPPVIAAGLVDVLVGSLHLDFAFVRLCDSKGGVAVEITRGNAWKAFPEWLQTHLGGFGKCSCKEIVSALGGAEPCRGVVIPIGVNGDAGLVAAARTGADFPSEVDQLLLSVAANHAAAAFQNARLRQVIQRSETRLREVIESINEGMCVVGTDGLVELWNRGAEESLRRKRQDILGHPLFEVFPELQESRLPPALTEARRSGATLVLEDLQLTLEGANHVFLARIFPFEGGTTIFFNDVGERKRAEKVQAATFRAAEAANAASSLEDLFRSTHSIVRDLMPVKNLYVSLYNPYTETLSFPYFVDEHYPTPAPRKLKKGLTEYVLRTGKALLALPEVVGELEEKGQIEDDGTPSACWLGVPVKKGEDSVGVLAVHSYTEGVTFGEEEQKILTFVAAQMAMAIERMRAEAELKSALQMKSDFVSFATHQLRTPLAGIKWSLELAAREENLSEETASFIEDGRESAQRLIRMVNDLLGISRLESGKLKLTPKETSLAELTQSVLKDVSHYIEKQGHHLSVSGMEGIPAVLADHELLRQVILNMVSNAIKYTPSGGKIDIRMGREDSFVWWAITDTGIGIPKASQARLFEKFYRAENVYKIETEGTGLGLHLVKLIVEKSGGRIWCESEENKGSTFQFTLPLGGGSA